MVMDFKIIGQLKGLKKKYEDIEKKLDKIILLLENKSDQNTTNKETTFKSKNKDDGIILRQINGRSASFSEGIGWLDVATGQKMCFNQKGELLNKFND